MKKQTQTDRTLAGAPRPRVSAWARGLVAGALAVAALIATSSTALADQVGTKAEAKVACEVLEISATTGTPSMPASLRRLEKKFKRPPFSSWNNFALLSTTKLALRKQVPLPVTMSKGAAEVLLRDVDRSSGKRPRIGLAVTVNDASGKRVVDTKASVDAGDFLTVGYSLPDNSGHIVAITCE